MASRLLVVASALAVLVGGLCPVAHAERDHLVGYKVKDIDKIQPAGTQTLTNAFGSTSCTLKKVKFLLAPSEKNVGDDPRGGKAAKYVCWKAKCDGALPPPQPMNDQFAVHTLETKKTQLVCAPALAECESVLGGFCWFLGPLGQDCDTVCDDNDRTYDAATDTYAGSTGSNANCQAVLNDVGVAGAVADIGVCAGGGLGCYAGPGGTRCLTPPTVSGDSDPGAARLCACQ